MSEPVAVPVQPSTEPKIEKHQPEAHDELTMIEGGTTFETYLSSNGSPFVADFFGLRDLYQTNSEIKTTIDQMTEEVVAEIDGHNLIYAAKDKLQSLIEQLNLQETDSGIYKMRRVRDFLKMRSHQRRIAELSDMVALDIENDL